MLRQWWVVVAIAALALTPVAFAQTAQADEPESADSVEELLARIAAEREALATARRQQDDVEAELESLRTRLEELEAQTEERSERIRRLEGGDEP